MNLSAGGGILIDSDYITVTGGGIDNNNDDSIIADCTITNNHSKLKSGGLDSTNVNDIEWKGLMLIKNNTSGTNGTVTASDLEPHFFLELAGYCYLKGSIDPKGLGQNLRMTMFVDGAACAAVPEASPAAGHYAQAQKVTLSSATEGATIYYTAVLKDGLVRLTGDEAQLSALQGETTGQIALDLSSWKEQLAAVLYRYAQYKGLMSGSAAPGKTLAFDDLNKVSDYALAAVRWACNAGLLEGSDNQAGTARAQAAAIPDRFCHLK